MIALEERILRLIERQEDMLGNAGLGRAHTATLRVGANGDNSDGLSWRTAFQTIPVAIAAASADAEDLTELLLAPGTYDMDTTGDPDITKNIVLQGSHRNWTMIVNNHVGATTVIGFTAYAGLYDLTIECGTGNNNGVAFGGGGADGARLCRVYIEAEHVTGAQTGVAFVGGMEYVRMCDVKVHGVKANTTGLLLNNCALSLFEKVDFVDCLTGLNISNIASDGNIFTFIAFANCTLGLDINGGDNQFFHELNFAGCTRNVDDEVGNHTWVNIHGRFDIENLPDDFVGIAVATGAANTYGGDTEVLSAVSRDNPFRIVSYNFGPDAVPEEWYMVRFSDDTGATFFDIQMFISSKKAGAGAPAGTEHIFNAGTRISCSAKTLSGGDNVDVWVGVQEI